MGSPPAMVRVVNSLGPCRSYGSGTIVHDDGRRAIVLSCAHLFREGTGRVQVRFPDGRSIDARPTAIDTTWDLSALEIESTAVTPVALATVAPAPGQWLKSCGFGPNGVYQCNTGTARGYAATSQTGTHETLCLTGSARDGDSGGPVLNRQGQLVGVLWGTDGRTVHATYCGRIRKFLARLLPNSDTPQTPVDNSPGSEPPEPGLPDVPLPDRFAEIANQLARSAEKQTDRNAALASRLGRLETALDAGAANPASSILVAALPGLLAALGWTAPPSLAALLALKIGLAILRRRARRKRSARAESQPAPVAMGPWNDQYAAQLNEVYALSGRSPTADATLGREYDRELLEMETSADDITSRWAHNLRRRIADRFMRIHDQTPLPAEPTAR